MPHRIAGFLAAIVLLSACGTKGPLYLPQPDKKSPAQDNKTPARP